MSYNNQLVTNNIINDEFKNKIINEIILPSYRQNIEHIIRTKTCWSVVSNICLSFSTILIGVSSLLSFSSSSFPANNLNYYAGAVGVIAIILKEFAAYSNNQDHLKTIEVNDILKNLGIDIRIPDESTNNLSLFQESGKSTSAATNNDSVKNPLIVSSDESKSDIITNEETVINKV